MKIKHIARIDDNPLDSLPPFQVKDDIDNIKEDKDTNQNFKSEEEIAQPEITEEESPLVNVEMEYIDPTTGLSKLDNAPTEIKANDGMDMLSGTIKIDGINPENLSNDLYQQALTEKIIGFINSDIRINVGADSLITNELDIGIVSFLTSPAFKLSNSKDNLMKTAVRNAQEIEKRVNRAYNSFIKELGDLDNININKANKELYELAEKVSFLDNLEKLKLRTKIRKKLREHGVTLTYIEVNC